MLAKACATESKANFIFGKISDLLKSEVGESEKQISKIFQRAKLCAPCILFFDEFQAMFGDKETVGRNTRKMIFQFIFELNQIEEDSGVIVLAATNAPWLIDESLLSTRIIDRHIYVGLPEKPARKIMFQKMLQKMPITITNEQLEFLSEKSSGFTGADVKNVCQLAGMEALTRESTDLNFDDIKCVLSKYLPSTSQLMLEEFEKWRKRML
ncbi:atpase family protein [Anaeramoeba flamelloides]|uniref:Atpase family protein n=1 Tax=Anaeramoeba flamelloides TaxID=1746091 RepID=A0AAV7Z1F4_9EUKA|nr:atpase family protein 2 [Anaeramoeba flamelloides]KAJ6241540.1 atpase family protein [Anaeramoeba flamelloides]